MFPSNNVDRDLLQGASLGKSQEYGEHSSVFVSPRCVAARLPFASAGVAQVVEENLCAIHLYFGVDLH